MLHMAPQKQNQRHKLVQPVTRPAVRIAVCILETPLDSSCQVLEGRLPSRQCEKFHVCVFVVVILSTCQTGKASKDLALVSRSNLRTRQEQLSFVDLQGDRGPASEPWTAACARETRG